MTIAVTDTGDLQRMIRISALAGRLCETPPPDVPDDEWYETWFPDENRTKSGKYTRGAATAIAICNMCDFREQCLEDTLAREGRTPVTSRFGIFGGADPRDRVRIMRRRKRAANKGRDVSEPASRYSPPLEDATPLRERMQERVTPELTATQLDALIGDAIALSAETIQVIRTGRRTRVRPATYKAVMTWFAENPA